ncbi:MAG: type I methionyl aminopeptidase [Clostridia bacterium]|nr:type I methionyl aminopeptidase [Clostridia bacterium]
MITLKGPRELKLMREAGRIASAALRLGGSLVRPGVTTRELDRAMHRFITEQGATPSFLGYGGFPATACISVNEQVIHGIPGKRTLKEGDIVSIDIGAIYQGYHGDCAATFPVGEIDAESARLIAVTRQSFFEGAKLAREGYRLGDVGHAIQSYVESQGFSVVRRYVGHDIGRQLHEDPEVANFGSPGRGQRLLPGMTLAIEPMVNAGTHEIEVLDDKWTVITADGARAAHYENTLVVTGGDPEILTVCNLEE